MPVMVEQAAAGYDLEMIGVAHRPAQMGQSHAPRREAGRRSQAMKKKLSMPQASRKAMREPTSASVRNMMPRAARCGMATANSRQKPMAAIPRVATVVAEGPESGAGAMGCGRNTTRSNAKALTGESQEATAAAGLRKRCHKIVVETS